MPEEIILAANPKDVLTSIRRRFFPYTQQTIRSLRGDARNSYCIAASI
jgi:hypothetical protein